MHAILLLWPLALGLSLDDGTQTPNMYDEGGSVGDGDSDGE